MKTIKFAVSHNKLNIYKKHLDSAGYSYTVEDTVDFLKLCVRSNSTSKVQRIMDAAGAEVRSIINDSDKPTKPAPLTLYRFGGAA